jgi:CO/xanthine dehydrogenase FAD-binding subunit
LTLSNRGLDSAIMVLADEFDRLIEALEAAGLEYALAGGLAVAVWGAPRATKDIDLLVPIERVDAVKGVARTCGFVLEAGPMRFRDGTELRRVSKVEGPDLLTLDLMLVNPDLEPAWRSRQRVPTLRGQLWVVSREALIEMKARAARPQDLFDIERLQELDR